MEKNWVKVYSAEKEYDTRLIKAMLESQDIKAVEMRNANSAYTFLSDYELYVQASDVVRAKYLIEKNNLE